MVSKSLYDAASHSDLFSFGHDGDYEYSGAHALGLAAAQIPREDVFAGRVSTRPAHDDGHVYSPTDTCHDSSSSLRYGASTSGHGHSDTCRQPYANLHRDGAPSLSIHCSDRSARREHEPTEVFKRNCPVTRVTQLSGHDVQYELALGQQTPHSCRLSGSASCQHPGDTYDNVPGEGPQDIYTGGDLDIDANFPLALACARQALDVGSDKETEHLLEAFIASQSRVLKVISPLPHINGTHLREVIQIAMRLRESDSTPSPIVYTARPSSRFPPSHLQAFSMPLQVDKGAKIFLLYATHDQASFALSNGEGLAPALASDLEGTAPYSLKAAGELEKTAATKYPSQALGPALTGQTAKTEFRLGDWICVACFTHNFSRNMVCYGCGDPRHSMCSFSESNSHFVPSLPLSGPPAHPSQRAQTLPPAPSTHTMSLSRNSSPSRDFPTKAPPPTYPLLTPSGHALASGGRVRNISSDPLSPCVMYWPDNEPFPERGQFRPLGSTVMQYPPIVNTGNKGAAEKQPGDWVCSKCHYLNWRRRKVCQTCYPYAEGNGDSISQAVQAERIALLTNVLNSVNTDPAYAYPTHHLHRRASVPAGSSSTTPPFLNTNSQQVTAAISPKGYGGGGAVMGPRIAAVAAGSASARSRSQMDMRTSYRRPYPKHSPSEEFASGLPARLHPQPPVLLPQMHRHQPAAAIYQTKAPDGGYRYGQTGSHPTSPAATTSSARSSRVASPISSASAALERNVVEITPNAANLLPSFLQDLIQTNSPNSSPLISSNNSNYRWHAAQGQRSMSSIHSIHSSPSTSTSSWSLDEYNAQYAGGYDEGPAVHAQPRHPSYEYVSQALYQSQPRSATDTLSSVRTSPTSITNAASAEDDKQTAPSGGVGVIGVGRPSRLGPSNSSASGPSMSGGPGSIWKMDGAEQSNRVWKPAGADVVSAPGVGIGAYAIRNHHSMVAPPRHNGYNAPTGSVLEGHGHRLAGLDEHLAAHLTISG